MHEANHYGTLCEWQAGERYRYRFILGRCSWYDVKCEDGPPVEIKAAMYEYADGQLGNFKLYEKYHRKLQRAKGWWVSIYFQVALYSILISSETRGI